MKKRLALAFALLAVVTALATMNIAVAAPALHIATGGGTAIHLDVDHYTVIDSIAFTAQQVDQDGNAKGQLVLKERIHLDEIYATARIKCDVLYLAVDTTTGEAWLGLVVTQSDADGIDPGQEFVWAVWDLGEGNNAQYPDGLSPFYGGPASDALSRPDMSAMEWANGNIQVW